MFRPVVLVALLVLGGCATRPVNPPITHVDPNGGYTFQTRQTHFKNLDKGNLVILAFSGGGTRPDAARLLVDQRLTEETFVMWDLIHDRTHMHGDLPFDPFMIKQRMPYF
ncbi:MAG TPA: DUF6421 family protein, partial [Casimicrobiaceae bacterium]|nr:DUF6421 family protein [Casimicrobiaceae bacterium]